MTETDPRFPVGRFTPPATITPQDRERFLREIEEAPARLRDAVSGLGDEQVDTPYRDGGWTVRQVVHHVPDSHLNSYVRFRLALTEEEPTIRPYFEDRWAELADARTAPVEVSLGLLESIHRRWVLLLRSLTDEQWALRFRHPELGLVPLDRNLALYAWHGRHHVAHVTALRERKGWR
jgi:DinB family protein